MSGGSNLFFAEVVRKVGNHDLGLGRNAILRRTALLLRTRSPVLGVFVGVAFTGGSFT